MGYTGFDCTDYFDCLNCQKLKNLYKMNTVKATNEYIRLCQEVLNTKSFLDYLKATDEAITYGKAILDICGGQVWLKIINAAESLMPEDIQTVAGIPTSFQPKKAIA